MEDDYEEWKYDYSSSKGIAIRLGLNSAQIIFDMKTKRTVSDLISFRLPLVRDAYRKVYQLHAVVYNKGLCVKKIYVNAGSEESVFDSGTNDFPFMFSMIEEAELGLSNSWRGLDKAIMSYTKTKKDSDLRFASMFSYFASKSRQYEIDRFANLWAAMNSYYSYINKCYEKCLKEKYKVSDEVQFKKLCITTEADQIGAALWQMDRRYTKLGKDEANKIWAGNYTLEQALMGYTKKDIESLYNALYKELETKKLESKYCVFKKRAEQFGLSPFTFMLFEYSYNWRCKLFHGNRCTLLFSAYNDYEIYAIRTINYFLDRFLNDAIPEMFSDRFWNEKKQNWMEEFICHIKSEKESKKYFELLSQYKSTSEMTDFSLE